MVDLVKLFSQNLQQLRYDNIVPNNKFLND